MPPAIHDAAAYAGAQLLAHRGAEPRSTGAGSPRLHGVRRTANSRRRVQVGQRGRRRAVVPRVRRRAAGERGEREGRRRGRGRESGWRCHYGRCGSGILRPSRRVRDPRWQRRVLRSITAATLTLSWAASQVDAKDGEVVVRQGRCGAGG
ncbi:hypothetical protein BKA80DRAFT_266184 [Phyllosticta citrichinensis]